MTTTRVYLSTDSGAPVMNRATAGSAVAVLRACLVTGFGTKPPAGWTEPFTGTNKAAFKNDVASGGTGQLTRIFDNLSVNGTNLFTVQSFASMSDVDTGTSATNVHNGFRTPAQTTGSASWMVVADEHTFYFTATDQPGTATAARMFVGGGDTASFQVADAYRYFALGLSGTNANNVLEFLTQAPGNAGFGGTAAAGLSLGRSHTGTGGATNYGIAFPHITANGAQIGDSRLPARPAANSADEAAMPCYAIAPNIIRARMRGLYVPMADIRALMPGYEKAGDGFGGPGSVCRFLSSGSGPTTSGLWVETALEW
jgi:hypothetical protein